ncbi:MAG: hypothetical protein WCP89_04230 [archaeon]
MNKTKILFICMMGQDRSRKAMEITNESFSDKLEAKCAGVSAFASTSLTKHSVDWADKIICMERRHRDTLFEKFPEARKKESEVWDISSDFSFNDRDLEKCLLERIEKIVEEDFDD